MPPRKIQTKKMAVRKVQKKKVSFENTLENMILRNKTKLQLKKISDLRKNEHIKIFAVGLRKTQKTVQAEITENSDSLQRIL